MKDLLYILVGLAGAGVALWQFFAYTAQPKNSPTFSYMPIVFTAIGVIIALVCGALFMSGRVNRTEEIHITD